MTFTAIADDRLRRDQQIALPLHEELKLTDGGIGYKLGTGLAIPEKWDPRCKGIHY